MGLERSGQRFLWVVQSPSTKDQSKYFTWPEFWFITPGRFLGSDQGEGIRGEAVGTTGGLVGWWSGGPKKTLIREREKKNLLNLFLFFLFFLFLKILKIRDQTKRGEGFFRERLSLNRIPKWPKKKKKLLNQWPVA